jgi:hypothetical protein
MLGALKILVNGFETAVEGLPNLMYNAVVVEMRKGRMRSHEGALSSQASPSTPA